MILRLIKWSFIFFCCFKITQCFRSKIPDLGQISSLSLSSLSLQSVAGFLGVNYTEDMRKLSDQFNAIKTRIETLEAAQKTLEAQMGELKVTNDAIQKSLTALQEDQAKNKSEIQKFKTMQETLQDAQKEAKTQADKLAEQLKVLQAQNAAQDAIDSVILKKRSTLDWKSWQAIRTFVAAAENRFFSGNNYSATKIRMDSYPSTGSLALTRDALVSFISGIASEEIYSYAQGVLALLSVTRRPKSDGAFETYAPSEVMYTALKEDLHQIIDTTTR